MPNAVSDLKGLIRNIPDFPKPGILFRDISTLLSNGPAFRLAVDQIDGACPQAAAAGNRIDVHGLLTFSHP